MAIVDSGVDVQHADLAPRWRGGTNSWFNAVAANCADPQVTCATSCDTNTLQPCDYRDAQGVAHGTAVAGVLVGGSATGTAIGVAPGARWIAAKIFDSNDSAPLSLIHQAFAWLLDPDGNLATDDAPEWSTTPGGSKPRGQCSTELSPTCRPSRMRGSPWSLLAAISIPALPDRIPASLRPTTAMPSQWARWGRIVVGYRLLPGQRFQLPRPSACDGTIFPEVVAPGYIVKTNDLSSAGSDPNASRTISGTSLRRPMPPG